ncbi:hypothetical protein IAR55_006117 [Kwoniella newhampshirensis]|uniref:Uncharacterized protein n=1 Tax=Kwoniella newhampshirensis TaxID=1651941 RepID=A0AAW0YFP3_9TREE
MSTVITSQQQPPRSFPSTSSDTDTNPLDLDRISSHPSLTHSVTSSSASASSDDEQLEAVISSVGPDPRTRSTTHLIKNDPETLIVKSTVPPTLEVAINTTPSTAFSSIVNEQLKSPLSPIREVRDTPKKTSGRLNLSKSMQSLRKKKSEKGGRERASSVSEKIPPVPSLPAVKTSAPPPAPVHPSANAPKRPPLQSAKSGSFSSFFRKLTGRSNTTPEPTKGSTVTKRKSVVFSSSSATTAKPTLGRLNTASASNLRASGNAPTSSAVPSPSIHKPLSSPGIAQAGLPTPQPKETNPCMIPLPPSPAASPIITLPPVVAPPVDFSAAPTAPADTLPQPPTVKKKKPEAMLSLEGFEFQGEVEDVPVERSSRSSEGETICVEEEKENHDYVRPLAPIRIPSRHAVGLGVDTSKLGPPSATSPQSATTIGSSLETKIVTPTSAVSDLGGDGMKLAGSSPPRKAPVGVGLGLAELGRKESKWRKSVIGLSDKTGSISRLSSQKSSPPRRGPPPTSHEAYAARQQRIASNRTSCAPTLHSTASVAASARGMAHMSKEDEEMAETFFLS